MPPRLVTAILARNEAARDLREVIGRCHEFSDEVLLLDDGSHDDTAEIAESLGCLVKHRAKPGAWGNESPARAELWERGVKLAKDGWLLICDADQFLVGDPRPFTLSWESNTVLFRLRDMWSATEYRIDGFWQAHNSPRPWMVKPTFAPNGWGPQWSQRGIHPGHLPENWMMVNPIVTDILYWNHYGYNSPERRVAKHGQYLSQTASLSAQERLHADSILDDMAVHMVR